MTAGTSKINPVVELRTTLGVSRREIVAAADGQLPYSRLAKVERGNGDQADLATCRKVLTAYIADVEARLTDAVKQARALLSSLPATAPAAATTKAAAKTPTKKAPVKATKTAAKKIAPATPRKRISAGTAKSS